MSFDLKYWTRLQFESTPIYVRPGGPEWFVPNLAGDEILQGLTAGAGTNGDVSVQRFLARLSPTETAAYPGRAAFLKTDKLSELWLHITNHCNQSCSHCLFASGPGAIQELPAERILTLAGQGHQLGCRVFALTGGEPFIHKQFTQIVDGLLALEDTRVVVLTNGTLLEKFSEAMDRWDSGRLSLQISIDGLADEHDRIRGKGQFEKLQTQLSWLAGRERPFTLSMCVQQHNVESICDVVEFAARTGASNVHLIWYFVRGRGDNSGWVEPDRIFANLRLAAKKAQQCGVSLDNIDAIKSQVFSPSGTIFDGTGSGWNSLAIGPDGAIYPSPALVGIDQLKTPIETNLSDAWQGSAVLDQMRNSTVAGADEPLSLLLGGGDSDHSFINTGRFIGGDPYLGLYEKIALWLIAQQAQDQGEQGPPRLRLKMGDILESCGAHGKVATTHSNCLLAVADKDGRTAIKGFYNKAVQNPRDEICNPSTYPKETVEHIPEPSRVRNYGCGSPVLDANLSPGLTVVDLGSGSGLECFIAARLVGPEGKIIGVDMLDSMLAFANNAAKGVAERLGYSNVEFRKGYLEQLPIENDSVDVVVSNCVMNLSSNKRQTFAEIRRVLKPGGRLMISDVVCETEPDVSIKNDDDLRGQCIGGALSQRDLFGILDESGMICAKVLKRLAYRTISDHQFFSMTFEAYKPANAGTVKVIYRGPGSALLTHTGRLVPAGHTVELPACELTGAGEELLILDDDGLVTNLDMGLPCGCDCDAPAEKSQGPSACCCAGG